MQARALAARLGELDRVFRARVEYAKIIRRILRPVLHHRGLALGVLSGIT